MDVDPGSDDCQSYEASSFLLNRRRFDTSPHLVLWHIGAIGEPRHNPAGDKKPGLRVLADYLEKYYDSSHEVAVYALLSASILMKDFLR